jgi:hypothetical protein
MVEVADLSTETLTVSSFEEELPEIERSIESLRTYQIYVTGNSTATLSVKPSSPSVSNYTAATVPYRTATTTTEDSRIIYA